MFGAVIQAFVFAMFDARHDLVLRCLVAPELVRDQDAWHVLASFAQRAEERLGSSLVPSALHQDIKHVAVLINGPPEVGRLAVRSCILILLSNTHALDLASF